MLQTANIIAELLDLNDDGDVDDPTAANFIDHRVNIDLGRSSPVMPNPNSNPNPNPNPYPYPYPNPNEVSALEGRGTGAADGLRLELEP